MPDLVITVVPQDPGVAELPEDLVVGLQPDDVVVAQQSDDLVAVPIAHDLAVQVPLQDVGITATMIGPPGPPGPAGSSPVIVLVAFEPLGGQRVVKPLPAGQAAYASSDVPTDGDQILGVTQGAANAGTLVTVQTGGTMDDATWLWIVGQPVYCGLNGVLTQVPPEAGFLCRIGKATKPTQILLNVEEAIILA